MRSFLAIELPAAQAAALADRVGVLRPGLPPARWVVPENYHLTLFFLGEIDDSRAAAVAARLGRVFERHTAFALELEGGGCFPPRRPARVVWVGLAETSGRAALGELQADAAAALRELMGSDDRSFHPHLTVARCRKPWPRPAAERWQAGVAEPAGPIATSFEVREGVLLESARLPAGSAGPAGPSYRVLCRLPLRAAA